MPNSPHSSWNLSSRHVALKAAPPRVFDAIHGNVHHHSPRCVHDQPLAAGRPDPPPRDRRLRHQRLELALARGLDRDHHPRGPFAEQRLVEPAPRLHRHLAADADTAVGPRAGHRPLRQRHHQPALGAIVSGRHEPGSHGGANRRLHPALPGTAGARHVSAIPSIASANCQRIWGRSGEPKFMRSVTPSGRPPAPDRLRAASHPAMAAPRRGSRKTWRPLPSVEIAIARRVPLMRSTAASEPGRTSVLVPTCWSYWRYAHSLDAMVGEPISRTSASP